MKTFIVSRIGINHNGSFSRAKELIDASKECGCDAVRFYVYNSQWSNSKSIKPVILEKCELSFEQIAALKEYTEEKGLEFLATAFCKGSFEFLTDKLGLKNVEIEGLETANTEAVIEKSLVLNLKEALIDKDKCVDIKTMKQLVKMIRQN